jgi:ABC-2 type transport system permease protein
MVGFPVEVLTGHLSTSELFSGFVIQTMWLMIAIVLYRRLWRAGLRRYAAVGG